MNGLDARVRGWLVWLLPFIVLALVIGWEADWGRKWRHVPVTDAVVVPQPVVVAVLPEYKPTATLATQRDMVDRALFNPTRRPAPVATEAGKRRLQSGQFVLTGTLIIDGKATAFLRENAGGKSRRVAQGEQINGMLVAEVKPDRVKLTLGDEAEDLVLKVAIGPKTTTQPVAAPAPGTPAAAGGGGGRARRHGTPIRWPNAGARSRRPRPRRPRLPGGHPCSTLRRQAPICRRPASPRRRGATGSALGRVRRARARQGAGAKPRPNQIAIRVAPANHPIATLQRRPSQARRRKHE